MKQRLRLLIVESSSADRAELLHALDMQGYQVLRTDVDSMVGLRTALDALPGKTAGWWKSYAFSDGFHPTPYGHQLLAASVSRALARAGWL